MNCLLPRNMSLLEHNDLSTARYPEAIFVFISADRVQIDLEQAHSLHCSFVFVTFVAPLITGCDD